MYSKLKEIADSVFGNPKSDYGSSGWYEYNCPHCREENGGTDDNRHNLAILLNPSKDGRLWGHCWRCGYSGTLKKLVRENGTESENERLSDAIAEINEGSPILDSDDNIVVTYSDVKLPDAFSTDFKKTSKGAVAEEYMHHRGVGDNIIKRFGIGYATFGGNNPWIVIPSYDKFGSLNYWTARECFGKGMRNPKSDKKTIVFNEMRINWYEPVTIVEGPFDHIVVPNSIPLLGKQMDCESAVYKALYDKSRAGIRIMLDPDAKNNAIRIYRTLDSGKLQGTVTIAECPDWMDASDLYREYGRKGILSVLSKSRKIDSLESVL